jgi:hypothetical protein
MAKRNVELLAMIETGYGMEAIRERLVAQSGATTSENSLRD